jgi:hypothetical protein
MADSRTLVRALSVAAILLIAAAGFCLFDSDGDDHGAVGVDLCLSIIATALGTLLIVDRYDAGRSAACPRWTATPVTIAVLDPPPWSRPSA